MKTSILSSSDEDLILGIVPEELYAMHFYLYAASCMQKSQFVGFQKLFDSDADEELTHWRKWRDIANDYGFELEMRPTKAVEFKSSDETPLGIAKLRYSLELALMEKYKDGYEKAEDPSLKTDFQKFLKIQRKAVGESADLVANIESNGANIVNLQLLQAA